jgi:DNA-binding MarR family transcriptional regulator
VAMTENGRAAVPHRTSDALMQVSRIITAAVAHSLAGVGEHVSVPGLRVLVMLNDRGALNLTTVAAALGVNPSSASRTCDRLVASELVDRQADPVDRRQISLRLTDRGESFVAAVMAERRAALDRVAATMSARAQASLTTGLEAFANAAERSASDTRLADDSGRLMPWIT